MSDWTCHCGEPILIHEDGFTRMLCVDCDAVRCDAFPGSCLHNLSFTVTLTPTRAAVGFPKEVKDND